MKTDKHITEVVFRVDTTKDFKGTVYALFPHNACDNSGNVTTYQHVGQHSAADYKHCLKRSKMATELECADLKKELQNIGYNLKVIKKQNYQKFLNNFYGLVHSNERY